METWLAPAKLNLFLHVIGRRNNGFHWTEVKHHIDTMDDIEHNANEGN